jgi:hypothetical protein
LGKEVPPRLEGCSIIADEKGEDTLIKAQKFSILYASNPENAKAFRDN